MNDENYQFFLDEVNKLNADRRNKDVLINHLADRLETLESEIKKISEHFSGDYQLVASTKKPHPCPICCEIKRDGLLLLNSLEII